VGKESEVLTEYPAGGAGTSKGAAIIRVALLAMRHSD
jgi:hypothetical protein